MRTRASNKDHNQIEADDFYPGPRIIELSVLLTIVGISLLEFGTSDTALVFGVAIVYLSGFAALALIGGYLHYFIQRKLPVSNWFTVAGHLLLGTVLILINLLTLALYLSEIEGPPK